VKQLLRWIMAWTPYRIVRDRGANRFQAIETCLRAMKGRGFAPRVVIDGGAHAGSFSIAAQSIFPQAIFHLSSTYKGMNSTRCEAPPNSCNRQKRYSQRFPFLPRLTNHRLLILYRF
jgi:ribosomal protein L11 methylase PrmA